MKLVAVRWLLALLTPVLLGVYSASGTTLVGLPYVALVPWLILYTDDRHPRVSLGYFLPAAWLALLLLYRELFRFGWQFSLAFATAFMLPWLIYAPIQRRLHHRLGWPRTWSFALVWVAVELVRAMFTLSHFDLFRLGNSQAGITSLIQIADITGEYGVSFLVAAVNGLVADVYFALRDAGWTRRGWRVRRNLVSAGVLASLFVAANAYGLVRLSTADYEEGPRIAIVQPNLRHSASNTVGVHLQQIVMTDEAIEPGEADLIVWPENAILDNLRRPGAYLDDLSRLAEAKSAWFLVGSMGKSSTHPGRTTNGAFLVNEAGQVVGEYHKQVLFPWSEFVPLDGLLGRVARGLRDLQRTLVRRGWGFMPTGVAGERMVLLDFPGPGGLLPFATLICVENAHPPVPAAAGRMGARFFVNITSEGEVGGSLQVHMLRTCMLRAVESRISYVRVGNTGVSCFIGPEGRIQSLLRGEQGKAIFDAGVLIDTVRLSSGEPTLYALSRDAFAKGCLGLTVALLVWTWIPRRKTAAALLSVLGASTLGCAGGPSPGTDPAVASDALGRGKQLAMMGDTAGALEALAESCADPVICRSALPFIERGFLVNQQPERGVVFMDRLIELQPELSAAALRHRAFLREKTLEMLEAEQDYIASLASEPDALTYERLGALRMRLDKPQQAIESFRAGVEHDPGNVSILALLGRALRIQGELEEARAALERALSLDPAHAQSLANLARVYLAEGNAARARSKFLEAIRVDPKNIEARYQLTKMAFREGDVERAKSWIRQIRAIEASFEGRSASRDG